jgi:hypothetical protein
MSTTLTTRTAAPEVIVIGGGIGDQRGDSTADTATACGAGAGGDLAARCGIRRGKPFDARCADAAVVLDDCVPGGRVGRI